MLVELSWVLRSVYKLPRDAIAETLNDVLCCGILFFKRPKPVKVAIDCFVDGYDLADALILRINTDDGATVTYTFDKKAARVPGYELLEYLESG